MSIPTETRPILTIDLADKNFTNDGDDIAINETVTVQLENGSLTACASYVLQILKDGTIYAQCDNFADVSGDIVGTLDTATTELQDVFEDYVYRGRQPFELVVYDTANKKLLTNGKMYIYNNPYNSSGISPSSVGGGEVYTTGEKAKLATIEEDADVTDASNVTTSLDDILGSSQGLLEKIATSTYSVRTISANVSSILNAANNAAIKTLLSLNNVANLDTSNPANITQSASYRFVTDTEKGTWNGKQDALGFTAVPNTRTINGKVLNANIIISSSDVGSGTIETASNIGGATGELFFQKDTTDLEFKTISGTNLIDITNSSTTVDVQADINSLSALTSIAIDDELVISDTNSSSAIKKITLGNVRQDINNNQTASYQLVLSDAGKTVWMDSSTANTLTIPASGTVNFPVNTAIAGIQEGIGTTTITAVATVTLNGVSTGSGDISGQYKGVTLIKRATDTWIAVGAIGTVS